MPAGLSEQSTGRFTFLVTCNNIAVSDQSLTAILLRFYIDFGHIQMIELLEELGLATATLSSPPVNAINDTWLNRFNEILAEVEASEKIKVLLIRSGQKQFCAGADLSVMKARFDTQSGREQMVMMAQAMQTTFSRLENLPVITIAQLHGAAMGGGLELALACDLRIAAKGARIALPEITLGLLPGAGGTQRLTRICGEATAKRLILGGEVISGELAEAFGVVHWAVDDNDLEAFTRDLTNRLSTYPKLAISECKKCISAFPDERIDGYQVEIDGTRKLYESPESQGLVRAFLEKTAKR